jgi:hypothetical protein
VRDEHVADLLQDRPGDRTDGCSGAVFVTYEAAQLVASPWQDELGQLDVFRLILATGIVAFVIGLTLAAASWEKWVVN